MTKRPPQNEIIKAFKKFGGNVTAVAKYLSVTNGTIYNWLNDTPTLKAMLQQSRRGRIDHAVDLLWKKMLDGDTTAIIFYLKTQARWSEKQDHNITVTGMTVEEWKKQAEQNMKDSQEAAQIARDLYE